MSNGTPLRRQLGDHRQALPRGKEGDRNVASGRGTPVGTNMTLVTFEVQNHGSF